MSKRVHSREARRGARRRHGEGGFSLLQVLIVLAVLGIVAAFATINIAEARANMRRINSARQVAGHLEKARVDSIRRHADETPTDTRASVTIVDANTYRLTLDLDGDMSDGLDPQDFDLEPSVSFAAEAAGTVIRFDWRGRAGVGTAITLVNRDAPDDASRTSRIAVSGLGDIGLGDALEAPEVENATAIPTPTPAGSP
ncbi:MAG: type II secretion system GspH family protein [Acidobacteriota bacterium]|nr:type II secretion system GspH family protein [Acidobacteriota bacterium]